MSRNIVYISIVLISIAGCAKKQREGIALVVNGYEITSAEVLQAAQLLKETMTSAYPEKVFEFSSLDFSAGAAQQLIANRLLIEEAKQLGIEANGAAVDSAYALLEKRFPDHATFEREIIKMGETDSSFREQILNGIRIDSLMKKVLANTPPIDTTECREFYEKNKSHYMGNAQFRARQIFFPFVDSISEAKKSQLFDKALEVRRLLLNGADFAEYAKKFSQGPGALEGGDIGWFKEGDLRPELEEPLFKLNKGEISDVVSTEKGLFILQKTDEKPPVQLPYKDVEKRIRFLLEMRQRNRIISRHIDSLFATAKIQYFDTTLSNRKLSVDLGMNLPQDGTEKEK